MSKSDGSLVRYVAVLSARSIHTAVTIAAPEREHESLAEGDLPTLRERLVTEFPDIAADPQETSEGIVTKHFGGFSE